MIDLIVPTRKKPDHEGNILTITPESAKWKYVGFHLYSLKSGQHLKKVTRDQEVVIVLLSGRATVTAGEQKWENIGKRMSVFEKTPPYSVYLPPKFDYEIEALTELEVAICSAPGKDTYEPRLISPEDVDIEIRGNGNMERQIHNILPEQKPANSLLVVEVFTPDGHWSSYPPHKHDQNNLPDESFLEETYYFKVQPNKGFAIQRIYTDDDTLNQTLTVKDGDAVMVPKGYHPVSAPPGYNVYYLNVMAGPVRNWKFKNDPAHEWIIEEKRK